MTRPTIFLSFAFLFGAAASGFAQDHPVETNFPNGPQYLAPSGSALFLRSIETPSLSLSEPRSESPNAPAAEHSGVPDTPAFGGFQNEPQIDMTYWGLAPNGAPVANPAAAPVVILEPGPSAPPPSGFDAGVTKITTVAALRREGYGMSLAEAAAYWRSHKPSIVRLYTNEDLPNSEPKQ